jgi:hypothetical protein
MVSAQRAMATGEAIVNDIHHFVFLRRYFPLTLFIIAASAEPSRPSFQFAHGPLWP